FGDEIGEGHGVGIVFAVEEIGLDPGRDDFDEFDVCVFEFVARGQRIRVNGSFGGAVDGSGVHRCEAETGRKGHEVGGGLLFEVLAKGGGDANLAQQVGGDDRGCLRVVHHGGGFVDLHDAGVVHDSVEFGIVGDEFFADGGDVIWIRDVEFDGLHAGVRVGDFGEVAFAAAGDDDLIAEFVEGF